MVSFSIVSARITAALRRQYLREVLHRDATFHETVLSSGTVCVALSSHCNAIQSGLADKFGLSLQSLSTVATAFVVAFTSQWKLRLVTATVDPAIVVVVGITAVFDSKLEEPSIPQTLPQQALLKRCLAPLKQSEP
jgi:ATP-binding cassette subfamily B (MDR/TAP) protein 1